MKINSGVKFMKIKKISNGVVIGFLSVVMFFGMAFASESIKSAGSLAMPSIWEGGTARAMSMGSAVVAVPQGSASLFWNPAGLGRMNDCMEVGLHHNSGLDDSIHETGVIGMPLGVLGGVAASLSYVNNGSFQGRDSAGNITSDYTAGDMGASVGWGKEWFESISIGAVLKYNHQTLANTSYNAYAADLGFLWNPIDYLDLGLTYSNLGTKVADSTLDSGCRVGASYQVSEKTLLAVSSELKTGGFDRVQLGVETYIYPIVALRAGYIQSLVDTKLDGLNNLTAGLGITIVKNIILDYAYIPYGDLGTSQRISLTYKFACKSCEKKAAEAKTVPVSEVKVDTVVITTDEPLVVVLGNEKLIVLDDTHFIFDSSSLTAKGAITLIQNAKVIRDNPEARIRIAGYASAAGTVEYNQKLSERRAMAVKEILVKEGGIAPERLTTIGYGDTRPAMFEPIPEHINSKEAHANMRVLFEVIVK